VRALPKIFDRYLKKGLIRDMIPFCPITLLFRDSNKNIKLFYLLKLFRFPKGMTILDMKEWIATIKKRKTESMKMKVLNNPEIAHDTT
jgi:hypothetical protein